MNARKTHQVRIIGGRWRGRKLPVPELDGLRPTPDRIRETLFNWLGSACAQARVLDCFAGSGALGLEALSRDAKHVTLVEQDNRVCDNLRLQIERLQGGASGPARVELLQGDVLGFLPQLAQSFDLVFIDPPYALGSLRHQVVSGLIEHRLLNDNARIYFEWPGDESFQLAAGNLHWLRQKKAGQVNYGVAECRLSR